MKYLPSEAEKTKVAEAVEFLRINTAIALHLKNIPCSIIPVGSAVKETFVSGEADLDFYILVNDPQKTITEISNLWKEEGYFKHSGPLMIWNFKYLGFTVDMVVGKPGDIKTDTIAHVDYFKQLTTDQKQDVIRLKALFKSFGFYGAENGSITGVAIENLVLKYGSKRRVLEEIASQNALGEFMQDPILATPRNLLASIIPKRKTQLECTAVLALEDLHPVYKKFTSEDFKFRYCDSTIFEIERKKEANLDFTILYSTVQRLFNQLHNLDTEVNGDFDVFLDSKQILIAVSLPEQMPAETLRKISKAFAKEAEIFKQKHPNWFQDPAFIMAKVPRKIITPMTWFKAQFMTDLERMGYIPMLN
jgi:hypothetical protein